MIVIAAVAVGGLKVVDEIVDVATVNAALLAAAPSGLHETTADCFDDGAADYYYYY